MGLVALNGQAQLALDIVTTTLKSNDLPSSIAHFERPALDARANKDITRAISRYGWEHLHRSYRLQHPLAACSFGGQRDSGIPLHDLDRLGYEYVCDRTA